MNSWWKTWRSWLILSLCLFCLATQAQPKLAVILGGIGTKQQDEKVLLLPPEVALSFIPYSPWGRELALQAARQQRDTLLHLPVVESGELINNQWMIAPGQDQWQVQYRLKKALADIPFVKGVNSHIDSTITANSNHMSWVMEILSRQGLYFVYNQQLANSKAYEQALAWGITTIQQNQLVAANAEVLAQQWQQALQQTAIQGQLVLFSYPSEAVLTFLTQALSQLSQQGIQLITLSELLNQPLLLPTPTQSEPELP